MHDHSGFMQIFHTEKSSISEMEQSAFTWLMVACKGDECRHTSPPVERDRDSEVLISAFEQDLPKFSLNSQGFFGSEVGEGVAFEYFCQMETQQGTAADFVNTEVMPVVDAGIVSSLLPSMLISESCSDSNGGG
jgi:hypothetical protein